MSVRTPVQLAAYVVEATLAQFNPKTASRVVLYALANHVPGPGTGQQLSPAARFVLLALKDLETHELHHAKDRGGRQ